MQSKPTRRQAAAEQPAGRPIPTHPDALLTTHEAACLIGLERRTLETWRWRGGGPPFVRISARAVRYRRADIMKFIESRVVRSTSDPGFQV